MPKLGQGESVRGPPELLLLLRRRNLAKARKALARQRAKQRNWTQEQFNADYEKRFHVANEANETGVDEIESSKPKRLSKKQQRIQDLEQTLAEYKPPPSRKNDNVAVEFATYGWRGLKGELRRQTQSDRLRGNKRAVGHVAWNRGKKKADDPRLKHVSDLIRLKELEPDN